MNKEEAKLFYQKLAFYYPRSFSLKDEVRVIETINDFIKVFGKWEYELCETVAYNWHIDHTEAPTVADLVRECRLLEIERTPYVQVKEEQEETYCNNPWQKALDRATKEKRKNPSDPHNFMYYVLVEMGYEEYKKAKPIFQNARNRRIQQNRELGIFEEDIIEASARFASKEEEDEIRQMIREGRL